MANNFVADKSGVYLDMKKGKVPLSIFHLVYKLFENTLPAGRQINCRCQNSTKHICIRFRPVLDEYSLALAQNSAALTL